MIAANANIKLKPRAPLHVIRNLENALKSARMTEAQFGFTTESVTPNGSMGGNIATVSKDEYIKEETRLYRESWIIPQIEEALAWAMGA